MSFGSISTPFYSRCQPPSSTDSTSFSRCQASLACFHTTGSIPSDCPSNATVLPPVPASCPLFRSSRLTTRSSSARATSPSFSPLPSLPLLTLHEPTTLHCRLPSVHFTSALHSPFSFFPPLTTVFFNTTHSQTWNDHLSAALHTQYRLTECYAQLIAMLCHILDALCTLLLSVHGLSSGLSTLAAARCCFWR